jgi:hypothetical protein
VSADAELAAPGTPGGARLDGARTYSTVEQILEKGQREADAERKAAEDPRQLTEDDFAHLHGETISRLMSAGQLGHLGFGGYRRRTGYGRLRR